MIAITLFLIASGAILWLAYELITAPKVDLYGNLRPSDGLTPAKFPEANVEFAKDFDLAEVRSLLEQTEGVEVVDDPANNVYPMPKDAHGKDAVLVGRLRRDESQPNTLNMWVVADNLRKGAATNAVQIAEHMIKLGLLKEKEATAAV